MKGTIKIGVSRSGIVPSEGRVQWIEAHGVIPEKIEIECVAELAEWEAAGAIVATDGTVEVPAYQSTYDAIRTALEGHLRADPASRGTYDVTPVLRAVVAAREARAAEDRAKTEAEEAAARTVAEALAAMPVDSILSPTGDYLSPVCSDEVCCLLRYAVDGGAWVGGRAQHLATDTIDALRETQKRRRAAERERVKAAEEAGRQAIRSWVVECGDSAALPGAVVRAAREGRDVSRAVRDEADRRVRAAIEQAIPTPHAGLAGVCAVDTYGREPDKRVPTPRAYDVRDAIVSASAAIGSAAMVPGVTVDIGDFERFDVAEGKEKVWRSGIDVQVTHPWWPGYDLGAVVLTEPLAYEPDGE